MLRCHLIGITPAYAGKTEKNTMRKNESQDHPRIRGKDGGITIDDVPDQGSPPHTRERLIKLNNDDIKMRITPAYAGKTV